jgi:serine phosphatase RsbU (regulator of sigma subunit)
MSDTAGFKPQPTILIVDDEEMVTSSLGAFLEWETDYRILTFQSPVTALRALHDYPADIVIADFLMPEMNGLQFLARVRDLYPDVPRILLTGYADKEHVIKAINDIGLYHYFEKPWDNEAVRLVIENGLENKTVKAALKEKLCELDQTLRQRDGLMAQNDTLQQELSLARKVQQSMLPHRFPDTERMGFAARYLPAFEIGGDFYDLQPLADGRLGILLADMTGHGIQGALSTSLLKLGFSEFAHTSAMPADMLSHLNAVLCRGLPQDLPSSLFAAAAVITLDPAAGCYWIANAGLPQPLHLRRAAGEVTRIVSGGMVLGLFDNETYRPAEEMQIELEEGDTLLLYTDGLSEAINDAGELFEVGGIRSIMLEYADRDCASMLDRLVEAVRAFSSPAHKWDDMTLIGIRVWRR